MVTLVAAAPAFARRKKKVSRPAVLQVAVLPFTGKGSGTNEAKEALELELELVESVVVAASDQVEDGVRRLRAPWDAEDLAPILSRRSIDVLIVGARGAGRDDDDVLRVVAYAKDGAPRFFVELPLGRDPQDTAVAVVDALRPALSSWKKQRPIRLPEAGRKVPDRAVRVADVLADEDEDPVVPAKRPPRDVLDDDEPAARPDPDDTESPRARTPERISVKKGSPLDFNQDDAEEPSPKSKKKSKKRGISLDDSGEEPETIARSTVDDEGHKVELEDEAPAPAANGALAHTFAATAAFDGATWAYSFDGDAVGSSKVNAAFFPGGSVAIDAWPLRPFGIPWLGAEAEAAVAFVPFKINAGQVPITPDSLTATHYRVGAILKGRLALQNGIAFGARLGYRYYGASIEAQTVNVAGQTENLTVVPGFEFHAAAFGVEAFVPILLGKQRLELEVKVDGLPLTYYEEKPDDPGGTSLAYGWYATAAVRYDIIAGFFAEVRGQTVGLMADYSNQGGRKIFVGDQLETLAGGDVLNFTLGFSTGIGFMF